MNDSLSPCSRFMSTAHRRSTTLLREALQKWQKADAFGLIPSTAKTPAFVIDQRFVLRTDLRRPPRFNIGSISARGSLSQLFDWRVAASEPKHRLVLWSFKAPPRDARRLYVFSDRVSDMFIHVLWRLFFFFSALAKLIRRLNLLHWFVYTHARYLTPRLIRLSQWPYLCAFRGLISAVRGMKIEQSNHTFSNTYSSP